MPTILKGCINCKCLGILENLGYLKSKMFIFFSVKHSLMVVALTADQAWGIQKPCV